tara:strand:- start:4210 stop:4620 length:411 start_codon:yes stop_codon:yes gene_type:complete
MIEEIKNIPNSNKDIRSFGITIGIILFIISGVLKYYGQESYQFIAMIASAFMGLGLILPVVLKPIYLVWMTFAAILGWVMTRVILSIVFYFIMTPIGLITRLLGHDFLKLKKVDSKSYWNIRDSNNEINQDYEKQF